MVLRAPADNIVCAIVYRTGTGGAARRAMLKKVNCYGGVVAREKTPTGHHP